MRPALSTFSHPILDVVLVSAKEEVIGADTRTVIALVQYPQFFREFPEHEFVGYSVGAQDFLSNADLAISSPFVDCSGPDPASIAASSLHIYPEAFRQWTCLPDVLTGSGTERADFEWDDAGSEAEELAPALNADKKNPGRLITHLEPPVRGATPEDVSASLGHLHANFTTLKERIHA